MLLLWLPEAVDMCVMVEMVPFQGGDPLPWKCVLCPESPSLGDVPG